MTELRLSIIMLSRECYGLNSFGLALMSNLHACTLLQVYLPRLTHLHAECALQIQVLHHIKLTALTFQLRAPLTCGYLLHLCVASCWKIVAPSWLWKHSQGEPIAQTTDPNTMTVYTTVELDVVHAWCLLWHTHSCVHQDELTVYFVVWLR